MSRNRMEIIKNGNGHKIFVCLLFLTTAFTLIDCGGKKSNVDGAEEQVVAVVTPVSYLGRGFDEIKGTDCAVCLSLHAQPEPDFKTKPSKSVYTFSFIDSYAELSKLSASVFDAKFGYSTILRAEFEREFIKQSRFTELKQFLVLSVIITYEPIIIKSDSLNNKGIGYASEGCKSFSSNCGTVYQSGEIKGGIFIAFIEFNASSSEELESLKKSLNASSNGLNKVDGSLTNEQQRQLSSILQNQKKDIKVSIEGGDNSKQIPTSIDSVISRAVGFPKEVALNDPAHLAFIQSEYKGITGTTLVCQNDLLKKQVLREYEWIEQQIAENLLQQNSANFVDENNLVFSSQLLSLIDGIQDKIKANYDSIEAYRDMLQDHYYNDSPKPKRPKLEKIERFKKMVPTGNFKNKSYKSKNLDGVRCPDASSPCTEDRRFKMETIELAIESSGSPLELRNVKITCSGDGCRWNTEVGVVERANQSIQFNETRTKAWVKFDAGSKITTFTMKGEEWKEGN